MTIYDSYILIMQYSLRHCLTKQATSDLLKLVGMLLPTKSMVSHYKFQKYFLDLYDDLTFTKRYCCSKCHSLFKDKEDVCGNGCEMKSNTIEFLTISVAPQLKRKFEGS